MPVDPQNLVVISVKDGLRSGIANLLMVGINKILRGRSLVVISATGKLRRSENPLLKETRHEGNIRRIVITHMCMM